MIALILRTNYGFLSLMVADSLKHVIHMTISLILLRRRFGRLGSQRLPITLLKVALATIVMALVTYLCPRLKCTKPSSLDPLAERKGRRTCIHLQEPVMSRCIPTFGISAVTFIVIVAQASAQDYDKMKQQFAD